MSYATVKVPLLRELEIESKLVPHRRGELYALAAAEITHLTAALAEERERCIAMMLSPSASVGAIPESDSYADGWNACRKEVFEGRQRLAAAIRRQT